MFSIKGDIIHTPEKNRFDIHESSYIFIDGGKVTEISPFPKKNIPVHDFTGSLIIPSFSDIHTHAPQYENMGIGYSLELLPWLENHTFPTESKFSNQEYAAEIYKKFIHDLWLFGTFHSCVFATIFKASTDKLFDLFDRSRLYAYIGKVNMNRNSAKALTETTENSVQDTFYFAEKYSSASRVKFIVTPRFVPSVTAELMAKLADIAEKYDLPVQSHLNENPSEIEWVKTLHPEADSFTQVYEHYGLLRKNKTIMAHSIHTSDKELEILKKYNTTIAHCPESNMNLASGIMPLRKNLVHGIDVALASDISAGSSLDMRRQIVSCIQLSQLYHREHPEYAPLSLCESFYLATKGSENFFTDTGSFEIGKSFDALIIESENKTLPSAKRLEKFIYAADGKIIKRYLNGKELTFDL